MSDQPTHQDQNQPESKPTAASVNEDWLAVYALGGLDEGEKQQLEQYLEQADQAATAELARYQQMVDELPYAARPMQPSAGMTHQLLARVEADAAARQATAKPATFQKNETEHTQLSWWERLTNRGGWMPLATAGALAGMILMIGVLGYWNSQIEGLRDQIALLQTDLQRTAVDRDAQKALVAEVEKEVENLRTQQQDAEGRLALITGENILLTRQLNELTAERDQLQANLAMVREANLTMAAAEVDMQIRLNELEAVVDLFSNPDAESFVVNGTEIGPAASGQIVFNPSQDVAVLAVANLPPLAEGQVYQVLLIRGSEHDTAETFQVNTEGESFLIVHAPFPFETFDTLGISIEPEGGSPQRTGEIVLLGSIIN